MKYPVFYWDKGVAKGAAGTTRGPVIFIRPAYRDDKGLYEHELVHAKQFWVATLVSALLIAAVAPQWAMLSICVHGLLYLLYPQYRLAAEVQAYREQLKHYKDDRTKLFASFIADHYGLKISKMKAEELLRK